MNLREKIEERLAATGLNPYSAATKAGLGASFVRDILRGKVKSPSAAKLAKLAEALDTTLHYLMGWEEPEIRVVDWRGRDLPASNTPIDPRPEGLNKQAILLPIRHELYGDTYRKASDVSRGVFGYEAGTLPPAYRGRDTWFELVADDSASDVAPKGSLVQVVEFRPTDFAKLEDGDLVIITKRQVGPQSAYHYMERSLRRVRERYPDTWFYEFPCQAKDQDSDDMISEMPSGRGRRALRPPEDEMSLMESIDQAFGTISDEARQKILTGLGAVEAALAEIEAEKAAEEDAQRLSVRDPEEFNRRFERFSAYLSEANTDQIKKDLAENDRRRAKPAGKVVRVLIPADPSGGFGLD